MFLFCVGDLVKIICLSQKKLYVGYNFANFDISFLVLLMCI